MNNMGKVSSQPLFGAYLITQDNIKQLEQWDKIGTAYHREQLGYVPRRWSIESKSSPAEKEFEGKFPTDKMNDPITGQTLLPPHYIVREIKCVFLHRVP